MLFLVPAAFPVDECPTLAIEDEDQEVMFYATYINQCPKKLDYCCGHTAYCCTGVR
jgi:hypothetical protein